LGSVKLREYNIQITATMSAMIMNTLTAIACPPNNESKMKITGQEMNPPSFSYLMISQSTIGKFKIPEIITITIINCLMSNFIRYHFVMMRIPTRMHNQKKIFIPISPKAILA